MSQRYKIVFSVAILHEYYADAICRDFELVPSATTAAILRGHGMIWKMVGHKLIILAATDESGKSLIALDHSVRLYFYMRLNHPHFYNFTNLGDRAAGSLRYYFSNTNQVRIGSDLYLTSKIAAYDSANEYPIGSFASNATNDVFESIKPSSNSDQHGTTQTAFWMKRGKFRYVNSNDQIEVSPFVYLFHTLADTNFTTRVFGFNPVSGLYDHPVMAPVSVSFSTPQTIVPVRLETLPPGKYRILINGLEKIVYLDGDVVYKSFFGICEISNHLSAGNHFSLFDASGKPKGTQFIIRFPNRSVIWKYRARTNDVTAVHDTSGNIIFVPEAGNQFVSEKPVPLKEKPRTTLLLKSTALGEISPLANPEKSRLGSIVKSENTYLCSEIYVNY
ncbi:MAG: hypothetical protein PHI28_04240 [Mangrovibacterium sp.]|nr:hypothetical protein [Mangrovibacterium sp.]